ncbi:MAG: hypothetical protein ACK40C_13555 [Novosphingobium meiothermophilum]
MMHKAQVRFFVPAMAAITIALSGCTSSGKGVMDDNGHRSDVPKATVVGKPVTCLPIASIRQSVVRDDWTIDFRTSGGKWYRNTLPNRCNGLGFERAFSYGTSLPQVCNVDIITVIINNAGPGPMIRGSCGLGEFTPVELEKKR